MGVGLTQSTSAEKQCGSRISTPGEDRSIAEKNDGRRANDLDIS
jgi:hypothetical protein